MYELISTDAFKHSLIKILKGDQKLKKKILKTLRLLRQNPHYPSLRSHKVNTRFLGERWSSWVTGDIRIIWDFENGNRLTILLLDIGSHSGTHKIYK